MNSKNQLINKLSQYGVDVSRQSQRSLQEKIIQMYDFLEQKTTQNLLLSKQNDDIKLQISTINDLFANSSVTLQDCHEYGQSEKPKENFRILKRQQTKQTVRLQPNSENKKYINQGQFNSQPSAKRETLNKKYLEYSQQSADSSIDTEQKTPRYSSKPSQNSRFCQNAYDKQQTSRMIVDKESKQGDRGLNQKIELLMKQNEIIMKRMNQIEVNFINKVQQQQNPNLNHRKFMDDRSTNFSSNIPSINNIRNKKEGSTCEKKFDAHNRAHYSSSNLRSYCPSVQ